MARLTQMIKIASKSKTVYFFNLVNIAYQDVGTLLQQQLNHLKSLPLTWLFLQLGS